MHQNHMRPPTNIRMNRNRENKLIILPIEIIKMIPPDIFNIPRIHKPMTIRRALDEHHRRQIVNVPVRRDLHETCFFAVDHGFHPLVCLFGIVDFGPGVAGAQVIGLAVLVRHAVVVFDAVVEEELGAFFACFPPVSMSAQYQHSYDWEIRSTMAQHCLAAACPQTQSTSCMSYQGRPVAARLSCPWGSRGSIREVQFRVLRREQRPFPWGKSPTSVLG